MTNEEIYKYALKKFGNKRENIALTKFLFGMFGFIVMYSPTLMLGDGWHYRNGIIDFVASLMFFLCLSVVYLRRAFEIKKEWREFTYNLVRQDERETMAQMQVDDMFGGKDAI